jgi:hypothetical protein
MPVILSILLFFLGIYFTENSMKTGLPQRTIASVSQNEDQHIKNKIQEIGIENVLNKKAFLKIAQKEGLDPVELKGTLLAEADDTHPNKSKHKIIYYIEDAQKNIHRIDALNQDEKMVGKKVSFTGAAGNESPKGYLNGIQLAEEARIPFYREHKMLILLFKFNNSMTEYTSAEEVRKATFNGAFQQFYKDISDNKELHTGKVYGFYHLNRNGDDDGGADMPCHVSNSEIKEAAAHYQIDLTQYTQITTVSNCSEYGTIGGRANLSASDFLGIGVKQHYVKMAARPESFVLTGKHPYVPGWGGFVSILIHERGHNFGLPHSNALDCLNSPILYPCSHIEYGNRFDRMGGPSGSFLFNASQQEKAGWKKTTDFLHIKTPGLYSIDKLTSTKNNRKIGAYIYNPKNPNQKLFMLEFRVPDGMDSNLHSPAFQSVKNGAHLYTSYGTSTAIASPSVDTSFRIVDPHPSELDWTPDTAYESLQGEYLDVRSGLKISSAGAYSDSFDFRVDYDPNDSVCGKSTLSEWSTKPYVKLYYELSPLAAVAPKNSKPGPLPPETGDGSSGGTTLPPYNKEIKSSHIVLVPGDYFHLKIDTLPGDPMICERTNMEIRILNYLELQTYFTSTVNSSTFTKNVKNTPQKVEYVLLKVPAVELNRDRTLRYQVKNKITGETMVRELYLHIRSSHNAVIPIKNLQVR